MEDILNQFMQMLMANQKNTNAFIKNLETSIGQLIKQIIDQPSGAFNANTQTNFKEHCNDLSKIKFENIIFLKNNMEQKNKKMRKLHHCHSIRPT